MAGAVGCFFPSVFLVFYGFLVCPTVLKDSKCDHSKSMSAVVTRSRAAGSGAAAEASSQKPPARCTGDSEGPTAKHVIDQFIAENPPGPENGATALLELMCASWGRGWTVCTICSSHPLRACDRFLELHGATTAIDHLVCFVTDFVPQKTDASSMEAAKVACAFVEFCIAKGYYEIPAADDEVEDDEEESKTVLEELQELMGFDDDALGDALNRLAAEKFWDALEVGDDRGAGKKHKIDEEGGEEEGDDISEDFDYEDYLESEMNLFIKEVRPNGWLLYDMTGGYDEFTGEGDDADAEAFVPLPPDLAAMGRKGANFSSMLLGLRNGVWRPLIGGADGNFEGSVFGTIYPN